MTDAPAVDVVPATTARWDAVAEVFGTRGDPARCWCQWFRMRNADWRHATTASNRAALRRQLEVAAETTAPAPGLLAYVDGEPAGWCALAPRPGYDRLLASRAMRTVVAEMPDDDPADADVWSITCFVVRVNARRQGIASHLVRAAVDFARSNGARVVEAYPVDVDLKATVSSSELYHGTLSMFLDAGFELIAGSGSTRPVVRLDVAG